MDNLGQRKAQRKIQNKTTTKTTKKQTKQISIFTLLLVLGIFALIIGIYFGIKYAIITVKYKSYPEKMIQYGFNELYNNKKATAIQHVSNDEMLRVIIGALTNTKDITQLYYLADINSSKDQWLEYSNYLGINNVVEKEDIKNQANRIDSILFLVNAIEGLLNKNIEQTKLEMSNNVLSKFTKDEQILIAKAVNLGIIENKNSSIGNSKLLKGELNKLVIQIVEKYATVYYGSNNLDILEGEKQEVHLVTDKTKLPSNSSEYPYIVDNIDKEIYEFGYKVLTNSTFKNPKETYKYMGDLYQQTDELLTRYFKDILNIDYKTITVENFLNNIQPEVVYELEPEEVKTYVDYVKEHKIKLEGKVTPLLPIMYNNGEQYVIRTKITFNVLNSDTEYNLLFGDESGSVKYTSKQIEMYVDVLTGMTLNARSLRVDISCLAKQLVKSNSSVIVEK